ncbi:MAG: acylphosphatase [Phycisphaerae bacterium]|nr:acylphosphatase [Phycisphaerae bacterium]
MTRLSVRFSGRVQGVGFRATARHTARDYPVTGWVRNEPDGTVLMEIQGPPNEVEFCLTRLRTLMRNHISAEQQLPMPPRSDEEEFVIQR